jgi:hypothetical protein
MSRPHPNPNMTAVKEQLIGQVDRHSNMPEVLKLALAKMYPSEIQLLVEWMKADRENDRCTREHAGEFEGSLVLAHWNE